MIKICQMDFFYEKIVAILPNIPYIDDIMITVLINFRLHHGLDYRLCYGSYSNVSLMLLGNRTLKGTRGDFYET